MHEYLWLASQCISNCLCGKWASFLSYGGGEKGEGGVPGIVMFSRCIALTSGQHNSLTQTTVMYTLCTYILFCGSQQISLLLYSPFSLRFVYVNIYVKCALGFYKCHRARESERGRKRTIELSTLCTLCTHI